MRAGGFGLGGVGGGIAESSKGIRGGSLGKMKGFSSGSEALSAASSSRGSVLALI